MFSEQKEALVAEMALDELAAELRRIAKPMSATQPWSLDGLVMGDDGGGTIIWSVDLMGPSEIVSEYRRAADIEWYVNRLERGRVGTILATSPEGLISETRAILSLLGAAA